MIANLASTWLVPLVYVDFELRQDYIARVLCIERDKPMTVCKGSCFLSLRLRKVAEQQEKEAQVNPLEIIFFFQKTQLESLSHTFEKFVATTYPAFTDQKRSNPHLMGIFHPPRS
ncbi:MAG: hypothetical protein AAGA66_17750 [Bacteroidota bacterium]